jgi:iron complex transport system substrate-binding protein
MKAPGRQLAAAILAIALAVPAPRVAAAAVVVAAVVVAAVVVAAVVVAAVVVAAVVVAAVVVAAVVVAAAAPPGRIVSLNLCADQLVVLLAEPQRIVSLSHLARDRELSYVAVQADAFPINHATAEEILPLAPDLVVAGAYTARPAVALLRARDVPVLELTIPQDFPGIRAQIRTVAAALGVPERGLSLVGDMDRLLAGAAPPPAGHPHPLAIAWQAGGFTAGRGTLEDAVMTAAGLDNLASRRGLAGYGYLSLEVVVAGHPDLLIAEAEPPGRPSLRQMLLQHPALSHAGAIGRRIALPPALMACAGPFTALAVQRLALAAQGAGHQGAGHQSREDGP